ncbi:hypothetical protein [Neobacillus terrae]|uniref:hypothetical protein n=1 Tax=Neobacillus terrae TaxID=3034837 RepID=UPI00140E26A0|nr:hypothetical protein [Neobacillus terrae]NHM30823.1 hypothetical protein [Neobacillus terrae]
MNKTASLFLIIALLLAACSHESSTTQRKLQHKKNNSSHTPAKSDTTLGSAKTTTESTQPSTESTQPTTENTATYTPPPLRTDGRWIQEGRLYIIQGTITQFRRFKNGNSSLRIQVETSYQGAGGAYCPYENNRTYSFLLFKDPKINLLHQKVRLLVGPITVNDRDIFEGAVFLYILRNGQFVDLQGKKAILPPTESDWHYLEEHQGSSD